ncbi:MULTISPECIES: hypothetical protein [Pseudomonas]|nr:MULTISPECIES: hypothetical protein [Pseudomonas]
MAQRRLQRLADSELGQVQRVEHLITGDRRCVYRIPATPVS